MSENIFAPNNELGAKLSELISNSDTSLEEDLATIFSLLHSFVLNMWNKSNNPENVLPFMIYLLQATMELGEHVLSVTEKHGVKIPTADDVERFIQQAPASKSKH